MAEGSWHTLAREERLFSLRSLRPLKKWHELGVMRTCVPASTWQVRQSSLIEELSHLRACEVSYLPAEFTEVIIMYSKYIVRRNERHWRMSFVKRGQSQLSKHLHWSGNASHVKRVLAWKLTAPWLCVFVVSWDCSLSQAVVANREKL